MNKKDNLAIARLEKQIAELKNQLKAYHRQANLALYLWPITVAISIIVSVITLLLSKSHLSPIFTVMPLLIAAVLLIVYSAWKILRQQQNA